MTGNTTGADRSWGNFGIDSIPRAGVIGLGAIGRTITNFLSWHEVPLTIYDPRERPANLDLDFAALVGSPHAVAARSDVVIITDVDADQAVDILVGADGLLTQVFPEHVVVLAARVSLPEVYSLGDLCRRHEANLIDAAVVRGPEQDDSAGFVFMVGGDDIHVESAMPVLHRAARSVIHCGELGAGVITKRARDAAHYGRRSAVAEAAVIAAAGGVAPERFSKC